MKQNKMINKNIDAWSYSRLSVWQQCPFKAKLNYIDKIPEPVNDAMERGAKLHRELELFMKDMRKRKAPACIGAYESELIALRKNKTLLLNVEMALAFDSNMQACSWFDKQTWVRCRIDLHAWDATNKKALIVDYKTGRPSPTHIEQADLYAALYFVHNSECESVVVEFWYIDNDDINYKLKREYSKQAASKHLNRFLKLAKAMTSDISFKPKPSSKCQWCHYRKDNNGPCIY